MSLGVESVARVPTAAADLSAFGRDPWWLIVLKALAIFVILVVFTLFNIWFERKVVARMQHRAGPTVHGPFGMLQSLADGIKLALKEDFVPRAADRIVYILAPVISASMAFTAFAVIPLGPEVSIFGHTTPLQLTDLPVGVLFVLAMAAIGVYGIVLGGWASGSTYPLLGGLRSTAQVISYEIAMGLALVSVFLYAGSLSTSGIVEAQASGGEATIPGLGLTVQLPSWYVIVLLPAFGIYLVSMVGEVNRAPFDLPEAEGELVAGFMTEYSSLKYALFFLGEYINMVTVSALATTMFFGGWRAPWPLSEIPGANEGWLPLLWFFGKVLCGMFIFIWLRGTLPRFRYDQFMRLGWKVLIPAGLIWVTFVATARAMLNTGNQRQFLVVVGIVIVAVIVISIAMEYVLDARERRAEAEEAEAAEAAEPFDAFAGGYPVPPMPGTQAASDDLALTASVTSSTSADADDTGDSGTESNQEEPRG